MSLRNITTDHLISGSRLYTEPERDILETLKPMAMLRLSVESETSVGMFALSHLTGKGSLRMSISNGRWINYKSRSYFIAQHTNDEWVVESWSLTSEAAYAELVVALEKGRVLVRSEPALTDTTQVTYRVILTIKDLPNLKLCNDELGMWYEMCKAYLNDVMRSMVRWETHPSPNRVIANLFLEEVVQGFRLGMSQEGDQLGLNELFCKQMAGILDGVTDEVTQFVSQDNWAFYYVGIDTRGVYISRHRDARAIIWNQEQLEIIDAKERDA